MERVQSDADHRLHQGLDAPAAVQHDFQPVVVPQVDQARQVRQNEPLKLGGAQQRPALAPEVVPYEEDVDRPAGRLEDPPTDLEVVVRQAAHDRVDHRRLIIHLQVQSLHAQQVDRVVEERRPVAAEDRVLPAVGLGLGTGLGDVHPERIGPGVCVHLVERCPGQRMAHRLAVAHAVPLDAENRPARCALAEREVRPGVAGEDAPKVVVESLAKRLVVQVEMGLRLRPELRRRPTPHRNPVGLLMSKRRQHASARVHTVPRESPAASGYVPFPCGRRVRV